MSYFLIILGFFIYWIFTCGVTSGWVGDKEKNNKYNKFICIFSPIFIVIAFIKKWGNDLGEWLRDKIE